MMDIVLPMLCEKIAALDGKSDLTSDASRLGMIILRKVMESDPAYSAATRALMDALLPVVILEAQNKSSEVGANVGKVISHFSTMKDPAFAKLNALEREVMKSMIGTLKGLLNV